MPTPAWSSTVEWIFNNNNLTVSGKYRTVYGSGYFDTPPIRNDNVIIPFVEGRTFVAKFHDQQTIMCLIYIYGTSQNDLETNIGTLQGYFNDTAQHTLVRNLADGHTQVSNATAEARNFAVTPITSGTHAFAKATVDFILTTPGFS